MSYPPDPIKNVCSFTGKQISEKCFTYRRVQIIQILFRGLYSPEFDPPHKIMQYWFYYSIQLGFSFPPDQYDRVEMFCTKVVPVSKGHLGEASPSIFLDDSQGWADTYSHIYIYIYTYLYIYISPCRTILETVGGMCI